MLLTHANSLRNFPRHFDWEQYLAERGNWSGVHPKVSPILTRLIAVQQLYRRRARVVRQIYATKLIVHSAGAIASLALLGCSGIGHASDGTRLGNAEVLHLPGVGAKMHNC